MYKLFSCSLTYVMLLGNILFVLLLLIKYFLPSQGIDTEADILQANLLTLVLGLLEDPAKKEYFFQVSACHVVSLDYEQNSNSVWQEDKHIYITIHLPC